MRLRFLTLILPLCYTINIMATYKVPQDVEADDKLLGPFTFRQFLYLCVVTMAIAIAWALSRISIGLAIIPMPVIIFFGALALPLRKDQPMEIYMAALVSFYLKPRRRLWDPDGIDSLIEITVPKTVEVQLTKDITQNEAERRFSYLAEIVDSQGWAVRGSGLKTPNSAMNSDVYFEAQQIQDVLDDNNSVMQALDYKLNQSDAKRHQEMVDLASGKTMTPPSISHFNYFSNSPAPDPTNQGVAPTPTYSQYLDYNPYPEEMHQAVLQPIDADEKLDQPEITPTPKTTDNPLSDTSEKPLSPDIINLASNNDLSIEAIAREANRIQEKKDLEEEVVIKLR